MVIDDYDGKTNPELVVLDGLYVWAQIHKIPNIYRQEQVVDQLARRIGKVREVQLCPNLYYEGDYVWVRARVLTTKPLTQFMPLTIEGEGTRLLIVKYEKIPFFCQVCGFMGHSHEECGRGIWKEEDKKWGRWMLAQRRTVDYSQSMGGRFAYRGGRGRGRGGTAGWGFIPAHGRGGDVNTGRNNAAGMDAQEDRVEEVEREDNDESAKLASETNSASNSATANNMQPPHGASNIHAENIDKKAIMVDEALKANNKRISADNTQGVLSAALTQADSEKSELTCTLALIENSPGGVPPLPLVYVSPRKTNKRAKKGLAPGGREAGGEGSDTTNATMAGSSEGRYRAQ